MSIFTKSVFAFLFHSFSVLRLDLTGNLVEVVSAPGADGAAHALLTPRVEVLLESHRLSILHDALHLGNQKHSASKYIFLRAISYRGPCRVLVVLQELLTLLQGLVLLILVAATTDPNENSRVDSVQNKAVLRIWHN
jgi:hypothetical protein